MGNVRGAECREWGMLQEQSVVSGEMDRSHSGKQLLNISFVSKVLSDE